MPIYEYHCPQCGGFEHLQRVSEAMLEKCPACGKPVQKKLSKTSFQLKGSGWYKDGYGTPAPKKEEKKKEEKKEKGSGESSKVKGEK